MRFRVSFLRSSTCLQTLAVGILVTLLAVFAGALVVAPATAQGIDVGAVASTEGFGAEVGIGLSPAWRLRIGAVAGSYDDDLTAGDLRYDAEAEFQSVGGIFDWSPSGGAFHLSLGAVFNDHSIDGRADILTLALSELDPADVDLILGLLPADFDLGFIRAEATWDPVAPYVGFGWRSAKPAGLGFAFDLGVVYLGEADAEVTIVTDLPIDLVPGAEQTLEAFLAEQEREIEREAEDYQFFPVVRLSLFYRF